MDKFISALILVGLSTLLLATVFVEAKQASIDNNIGGFKPHKPKDWPKASQGYEEQTKPIEIEQRLLLNEPYKSLIQTTTRYALIQTRVANYVNIDTAMTFINKVSYMLSKPSTLIKAVKTVAILITTLLTSALATLIFLPNVMWFILRAIRDPFNLLNLDKYLNNGISGRTLVETLSWQTDDLLGKIGLHESSCRERSVCYIGQALNYTFPDTASTVTKFSQDNLPDAVYNKDNKYTKAFLAGFTEQNCTSANPDSSEQSNMGCLSGFINSVIMPHLVGDVMQPRQMNKYQTIHVTRT